MASKSTRIIPESSSKTALDYSSSIVNKRKERLFCKYWRPGGVPKALLFLSHGLSEHCLLYDSYAKTFAKDKFFVFAHDHIGHGQSAGHRGYVKSFKHYVDDIFQHIDSIRGIFPRLDCFLLGYSMGGTIAIFAALQRPDYFKGVVLVSPYIAPSPSIGNSVKWSFVKLLSKISYNFPVGTQDLTLICRDPQVIEAMKTDPFRNRSCIKAGLAKLLLEASSDIHRRVPEITFPVLILQGSDDKICKPQASLDIQVNAPSKDKFLKVYPNAYHCLLHEPNGVAEEVFSEIRTWLNERAVGPESSTST